MIDLDRRMLWSGLDDGESPRPLPRPPHKRRAQDQRVISSTSAPHAIITRDRLEHALAHRGGPGSRPLLLVDLATPRDIDPAAGGLTGVEVHTIDDLRPVVERTLTQRSAELHAAYSIVRAEVTRFTQWLSRRQTAADLRSFSDALVSHVG